MPIFDQGYQHWSGQFSPQTWRWLAIARHGVRLGMQNRVLRIVTLLAWLPAVAMGFILCMWGLVERKSPLVEVFLQFLPFTPKMLADPMAYRSVVWTLSYELFMLTEVRFAMILVLIVGPSLISQDLRFNALPLYFSRPVRRIDYFLGKLGTVAYFMGMVLIVPSLVAYLLGLIFSLDMTIIRDTYRILLASIGYGVIMTLSISMLILALSALTRNSRFVALFWVCVWFVSFGAAQAVMLIDEEQRQNANQQRAMEMYSKQQQLQQEQQQQHLQPAEAHEERRKRDLALRDAQQKFEEDAEAEELRLAKKDWRPMISYATNLTRIGSQLLGADASWDKLAQDSPGEKETIARMWRGPRYPWYWSAILLAVLFGFSVCILNFRVKSLDRLR
jgi:ABC-2 type transport system permease protein